MCAALDARALKGSLTAIRGKVHCEPRNSRKVQVNARCEPPKLKIAASDKCSIAKNSQDHLKADLFRLKSLMWPQKAVFIPSASSQLMPLFPYHNHVDRLV